MIFLIYKLDFKANRNIPLHLCVCMCVYMYGNGAGPSENSYYELPHPAHNFTLVIIFVKCVCDWVSCVCKLYLSNIGTFLCMVIF